MSRSVYNLREYVYVYVYIYLIITEGSLILCSHPFEEDLMKRCIDISCINLINLSLLKQF